MPPVNDHHSVGQARGLPKLMGGEQHSHPSVTQLSDDLADDQAAAGIDARCWLIEERDARPAHQRQRQREALLLTSRQPPPRGPGHTFEADGTEQRAPVERVVVVGGEETERLGWSHRRVDAARLEHHPDASPDGGGVAHRVEPEHPDGPARRASVAFESLDRSCLACPVRPEHGGHLARSGHEAQPVDGGHVAVPDDEIKHLDGGGHGWSRYRCTPPRHTRPRACP